MENIPSPNGHGWTLEDGELSFDCTNEDATPDVVSEFMACSCRKSCEKQTCKSACTDMCSCKDCDNFKCREESEEIEMIMMKITTMTVMKMHLMKQMRLNQENFDSMK